MTSSQTSSPTLARGCSTAEGTQRYRGRFAAQVAPDFFRTLDSHLIASSIGIGTYLGECDDADDARYARTVREALRQGINLVDSAINYRCQRSERAIGVALREAIAAGEVNRDEVIICTKGGYLPLDGTPPASRSEYKEYIRREFIAPGLIDSSELVADGHCFAPAFLDHQIDRSRENLGVRTIDVYYLHNPEQQLDTLPPSEAAHRLRRAFELLEQRVAAGDIGRYGCATWQGFRLEPLARGHLNLFDIVTIAEEVGGDDHHFRVVQLPINLAMTEGIRANTQCLPGERWVPLVTAAAELGVSVVASATLMQSRLATGLPAQVRETFPHLTTDAARAIGFVRSLPGISAVLVGMKSVQHLEQNLEAAT